MGKYQFGKVLRKSALSENGSRQMCNTMLFEEAVWHFITNHQMDEMIGNIHDLRRQTDMVHKGFDFESEELCIEIKIFLSKTNADYGSLMKRFWHSIEQMIGCFSGSSGIGTDGKRRILLMVGQRGFNKGVRRLIRKKKDRVLKKAADMGLELWVAEVEMEAEAGMELLSYENMTNEMGGGMGNG